MTFSSQIADFSWHFCINMLLVIKNVTQPNTKMYYFLTHEEVSSMCDLLQCTSCFAFILRSSHWGLPTREEFESISVLLPSDTWSIIGCCCCVKLFSLPYVSQKVFLQHPQTAWCKGHNLTFPVPYTSSSVYLLRIFYTLGG